MIIEKNGYKLEVDLEATKNYYKSNEVCDCLACQNFSAQAAEKFPKLADFLDAFGVNILRPDSVGWIETDNEVEYIDITYTVCGEILAGDGLEVDIYDSLFLSVFVDDEYVPNNHKEGEKWFSLTVFNVKLPWVVQDEE